MRNGMITSQNNVGFVNNMASEIEKMQKFPEVAAVL